jgi:hypothetical protein
MDLMRFRSAEREIARRLGLPAAPELRIVLGRVSLIFRGTGLARADEVDQLAHVGQAVAVARAVFTESARALRNRARNAIEVAYEDNATVQGCVVTARWSCVVPAEP